MRDEHALQRDERTQRIFASHIVTHQNVHDAGRPTAPTRSAKNQVATGVRPAPPKKAMESVRKFSAYPAAARHQAT
jgi:hypothetical protein